MFAKGPLKADHGNDRLEERDHHSGDDHGQEHHQGGKELEHVEGNEYHVKLNPDSPFMQVKNLSEELYTEIFVIASGDNYKSPEVSNDVHMNARTIVLLSQNLKNLMMAYPIIFNAITNYVLNGASVSGKLTMTILINDLVAQIRRQARSFESSVTDSFIARGKYFKPGAAPQEQAEAYDDWLRDPFVRAAVLNKLLFRAVQKNDMKPPYKILRAMLNYVNVKVIFSSKKAADMVGELQNIYTATVAKTAQTVCPAHDFHKAAIVFYQNLMELLSEDADLLLTLYADQEMPPGMLYDDKPF